MPTSKRCLLLKAKAYSLQGYWEDAVHHYDLALEAILSGGVGHISDAEYQALYEGRRLACLQLYRQAKWQQANPEQVQQAMVFYTELAALTVRQHQPQHQPTLRLASICTTLGDALYRKGHTKEALGYLDRADTMYEQIAPFDLPRVLVLTTIGGIFDDQNDVKQALEKYQEALEIVTEQQYRQQQRQHEQLHFVYDSHYHHHNNNNSSLVTDNSGHDYDSDDENDNDQYRGAISFALVHCLNNIGMIHQRQGKTEMALACFERTLPVVQRQAPLSMSLASCHNNIGYAMQHLGRYEEATFQYNAAQTILQQLAPSSQAMATCTDNMRTCIALARDKLDVSCKSGSVEETKSVQSQDHAAVSTYAAFGTTVLPKTVHGNDRIEPPPSTVPTGRGVTGHSDIEMPLANGTDHASGPPKEISAAARIFRRSDRSSILSKSTDGAREPEERRGRRRASLPTRSPGRLGRKAPDADVGLSKVTLDSTRGSFGSVPGRRRSSLLENSSASLLLSAHSLEDFKENYQVVQEDNYEKKVRKGTVSIVVQCWFVLLCCNIVW